MIPVSLRDAVDKAAAKFFPTSFGRILAVIPPQKVHSKWDSVSWAAAVSETVLVSPDGDGSIEICDLMITAEKKNGGSIAIRFADGVVGAFVNTKDVVKTTVNDGTVNIAASFQGKVQGWQSAKLYYTIVGAYVGSILITYVKHNKKNSLTYKQMAAENGW